MQSIKYLHNISTLSSIISQKDAKHQISPQYLHFIIHYISKRCKASNISTLSSTTSQKDAKHQISLLYPLLYLKKMQSIKYLHFIFYFISSFPIQHSQFNIRNSTLPSRLPPKHTHIRINRIPSSPSITYYLPAMINSISNWTIQ